MSYKNQRTEDFCLGYYCNDNVWDVMVGLLISMKLSSLNFLYISMMLVSVMTKKKTKKIFPKVEIIVNRRPRSSCIRYYVLWS